jgi:hypothetical protein
LNKITVLPKQVNKPGLPLKFSSPPHHFRGVRVWKTFLFENPAVCVGCEKSLIGVNFIASVLLKRKEKRPAV